MSHSNQCECGDCQTKVETEHEEVTQAIPRHTCFFDDLPATALLNGIYLCESHAVCATCLKPLTQDGLTCRCDKDGYTGHEELLWCSEQCMEHAHPEPDWDRHEVDETAEEAQG